MLSFYQDRIKDLEMKVQMNTTTPEGGVITAADEDGRRSLNIVVGHASGQTSVSVTYGSKS